MVYGAESVPSRADAAAGGAEWRPLAQSAREATASDITEHTSERKRSTLKRASHSRRPLAARRPLISGFAARVRTSIAIPSGEEDPVSNPLYPSRMSSGIPPEEY